jgi:uncharacterized protein YqgV (UPF0045/DUF77 family)
MVKNPSQIDFRNRREVEECITQCKQALQNLMTQAKINPTVTTPLTTLGSHLDLIHEIERAGLRNLQDADHIKIRRVMRTVSALLDTTSNPN